MNNLEQRVNMKNQADYSKYKCPYSHIEKECGHELKGPEGHQDTYGVWCECGFRAPVFVLSPEDLKLDFIASLEAEPVEGELLLEDLPSMNCDCKNPNYPYDCGFPDCHPWSHEKCLEKLYEIKRLNTRPTEQTEQGSE